MGSDRIAEYRRIRQLARDYLSGLVSREKYPEIDVHAAGKLLGMYRSGNMIFDSEADVSALTDFTLAERVFSGKSVIEREIEAGRVSDQDKLAILQAFRSGHTSLFKVLGSDSTEHTIRLFDRLRHEERQIVDVNLSTCTDQSRLLFFRIVSLKDFAMTSGMCFVFAAADTDVLLRRYRSEQRTRFVIDPSITRFLIFHRLNRQFGDEIMLV